MVDALNLIIIQTNTNGIKKSFITTMFWILKLLNSKFEWMEALASKF